MSDSRRLDDRVEAVLAAAQPHIAQLGHNLCHQILALLPDAVVTVGGNDIGFGFDTGYKGLVFTVAPARQHVTLGISHGVGLPDPAGLLEGTGKVHRHVKLRRPDDLDRPELRDLMAAALANRTPSASTRPRTAEPGAGAG
jgi:hypothetical protein